MTYNDFSSTYLPSKGLSAVIDLAIRLNKPLLVTGEPGTGKTQLSYYVAHEVLKLQERPLVFNTKTDSQARDLFYQYDAIRHFRDTGKGGSTNPMDYITFNALGKAIIDSQKKQSVVLIDEIDKAPRDFSNDLLYEFQHLAFQVKEATVEETQVGLQGAAKVDDQGFIRIPINGASDNPNPLNSPVLIITSNSEKNLPDAFMRRVLYHHIEFPNREQLRKIIDANISPAQGLEEKMVNAALNHFNDIRIHKRLRKPPATAELLSWIHLHHEEKLDLAEALKASSDKELKQKIFNTYSLIAKNKEDMNRLRNDLGL